MQTLLGACLLWALFSTGSSLICGLCLNLTGPCLESDPFDCEPDEDNCFDTVFNATVFGTIYYGNIKGCMSSRECESGTYGITTEGDEGLESSVTCCDTDYCNNATGKLPRSSGLGIPNGLACPSCYTLGTNDCDPEEIILCTGKETKCLTLAGYFDLSDTILPIKSNGILKGCATPKTCQALQESVEETEVSDINYNITQVECINAIRAAKNLINGTLPNSVPLPGR